MITLLNNLKDLYNQSNNDDKIKIALNAHGIMKKLYSKEYLNLLNELKISNLISFSEEERHILSSLDKYYFNDNMFFVEKDGKIFESELFDLNTLLNKKMEDSHSFFIKTFFVIPENFSLLQLKKFINK